MFIIVAFNALGCPNIPYISGPINIDHRKKQLINSLNIIFSYRTNFSHIPLGYTDIRIPYLLDSLWNGSEMRFSTLDPPDSTFDNNLNISTLSSFKSFYNAFLTKNNIYAQDTILYSFGVKRALNTSYDTWGYTFNFYYFRLNTDTLQTYPALCFTQVENINTTFNIYSESDKNKLKNHTTVHELTHARGLIDLNHQIIDYVHDCQRKWNGNEFI